MDNLLDWMWGLNGTEFAQWANSRVVEFQFSPKWVKWAATNVSFELRSRYCRYISSLHLFSMGPANTLRWAGVAAAYTPVFHGPGKRIAMLKMDSDGVEDEVLAHHTMVFCAFVVLGILTEFWIEMLWETKSH